MTAHDNIDVRFVDAIPETLAGGVVYISVVYATTVHSCACGCGSEVVLPLSPRDWSVTFDGETISLSPSVWNRRMSCGAHYWIKRNKIVWVPDGELEQAPSVNWLVRARRWALGLWRRGR